MDKNFNNLISNLHPKLQELLVMDPVSTTSLPTEMPLMGIYLFSEGERHLYVGRSKNIRSRIGRHSRPGATHRMAAFAFRLAREATGRQDATYKVAGSRADLMKDPEFQIAFDRAKARIRQMDIRFVEESEPLRQALLEIYVAVSLDTPYNDFSTH